jgi:2-polyprenyl-3-methyl-5-hydroxy-6-metoxy-1,4-benzoquinol methylase
MSAQSPAFVNEQAANLTNDLVTFSFGDNWRRFLETIDEAAIDKACAAFTEFSQISTLRGQSFLDLGSGSGLSSLVAHRLGADRIVSVDIDPNSVKSTELIKSRFAQQGADWTVLHGSVLDDDFGRTLGQFSYVYSWGVLHHTGNLWGAVDRATQRVAPNGRLQLALYNKNKHASKWLRLKQIYNASPSFVKWSMLSAYASYAVTRLVLSGQNPFTVARQRPRGMSLWRDIEDWLGGLPYEPCKPEEVVHFLEPRGFDLRRLRTVSSHGCNDFLFQRRP